MFFAPLVAMSNDSNQFSVLALKLFALDYAVMYSTQRCLLGLSFGNLGLLHQFGPVGSTKDCCCNDERGDEGKAN